MTMGFLFQYLGRLYWRLFFPLLFCFILLVRLYITPIQQHMLSRILLPKLMTPFALSKVALSGGDALTKYMLHIRATDRVTCQTHSEFRQHNSVVPAVSVRYVVPVKSNLWSVPNFYAFWFLSVQILDNHTSTKQHWPHLTILLIRKVPNTFAQ